MKYTVQDSASATETTSTADGIAPELTPIDDDTASSSHVSCPSIKQDLTHGVLKEPDNIRLLRISPGSREAALHGTLRVVGLQSRPDYEALSYTWADDHGDSSLSRRIYIGPFWDIIHITANCESALKCLRTAATPRTFWVDSICIDQDSDRERSHQVGMMSRIYSYASRVTAYLGPRTGSSDTAMDVFRRGDRLLFSGAKDAFELSESESTDLKDFFNRRYFSRLWIVQEISLAKALVFRCDDHSLNHPDLKRILPMLQESVLPRWLQHSMTPSLDRQMLVRLVAELAGSHCSDPRDHIFGLLGLCDAESALTDGLVPDYSLSAVEVFTGFAAYAALSTGFENVLQLAIQSQPTTIPLPSWVPNWAQAFQQDLEDWRSPDGNSIALQGLSGSWAETTVRLSVEQFQRSAFSVATLNGGLVVAGDWLVRDAHFTYGLNTPESPDTNNVTLHKAGRARGFSMTLRVTLSGRAEAGPALARSALNVFRVRASGSIFVLRTRPGSTQQELLGIGQLRLQARCDLGPWMKYQDYAEALVDVEEPSESDTTLKLRWRKMGPDAHHRLGRYFTLNMALKWKAESSFRLIWRAASPIDSRDSGLSLLRSFWDQARNSQWLNENRKVLHHLVSPFIQRRIWCARQDWTRLQELVTIGGGSPPTEQSVSSLVTTLEAHTSLPAPNGSGFGDRAGAPAGYVRIQDSLRMTATKINLWFCLTVRLLMVYSEIDCKSDLNFPYLRRMLEADKIWLHLPTPSRYAPNFAQQCWQRLETLSLEDHLTILREILRIHRDGEQPSSCIEGLPKQQIDPEALMAGHWDWKVVASRFEKAISLWEDSGPFLERLREVIVGISELDFLNEDTRREMQHDLGLSMAWDQIIIIN